MFTIDAVGDVTGRQRQQDDRRDLYQPHQADGEGRTGALVHFPADGGVEHLFAELPEGAPKKQQTKITKTECSKGIVLWRHLG